MQDIKKSDLEALQKMASAFDKEERAAVLSTIPANELIECLQGKCEEMMQKIEKIEAAMR